MVDYFFPPLAGSGAQRTLGFVNHLDELGWTPTVLTVHNGEYQGSFRDVSLLKRIPESVTVHRTASVEPVRFAKRLRARFSADGEGPAGTNAGGWSGWRGPGWLRNLDPWVLFPDRHIGWFPFALGRALSLNRQHALDATYSTSTVVTSHLVAYVLKKLLGKPWVADFQDPWSENGPVHFTSSLHKRAAEQLEYQILRCADRVTVTTESIKQMFIQKYATVSAEKFVVIPMGFEPENFKRLQLPRRSKFTLTHFGNFYGPRSPGPLLEALGRLVKSHPGMASSVEVLFFGTFDNASMALTMELLERHDLAGIVRVEGTVPYQIGLERVASSDVLLLVTDTGWFGRNLIPGKLFEYLAVGRPILALAPDGQAAQILREAKTGVIVAPDDVGAIADAILALHRRWKEGRLECPADHDVIRKFAWPALTGRLVGTLEAALNGHARQFAERQQVSFTHEPQSKGDEPT